MRSLDTHWLQLVLAILRQCVLAMMGCRQPHTVAGYVQPVGPGSAGFEPAALRAAPMLPRRPAPSVDHTDHRSEEKYAGTRTAAAAAAAAAAAVDSAADTPAQVLGAADAGAVGVLAGTTRLGEPSVRRLAHPNQPHARF